MTKYTKEFKQEAVHLAFNSSSIQAASRELGMPEATLHTWVQKAKQSGEVSTPTGQVNVGELIQEVQQLKNS